jgi:hypothetical protein
VRLFRTANFAWPAGKGRGERTARPVATTAHSDPERPALRVSPRPREFVHRIDPSDDANAALVEVLAALKIVIVTRYVSGS